VRIEVGGKEILIGVYPVGITVPSVPWAATGCLQLGVIWSGDGQMGFRIRVINPANQVAGEIGGTGNSIWQGFISSITFRGLTFSVDTEGIYDIQVSKDYGSWESIRKFPIFISRRA
jgi:hypothetical protein